MNQPFYGVASIPSAPRPPLFLDTQTPGPGTYDCNKHHQLPQWTLKSKIQHGSCFQELSTTPGPASYQSPQLFVTQSLIHKQQHGNKSIGKAEKYPGYPQKNYPSDHLNLPSCLNLTGGYSFGYREPLKNIELSPGPIYNLSENIEQKRRKKIQNSFRGFGYGNKKGIYEKDDLSPGPAAFNTQKSASLHKSRTCNHWTFGTSKRNSQLNDSIVGPGQYNPKIPTYTRSFKLRGKNELKQVLSNNTGPGSYTLPDTLTRLGVSIPLLKNQSLTSHNNNNSALSPCSYSPPRYLDKIQKRGYSLGQKLMIENDNREKPGPGAYQILSNKTTNIGGYISRKFNHKNSQNFMDNFYKYNPKLEAVARQTPKFSFPQGRKTINDESTPLSPNSHEFTMAISPKQSGYSYSMGTSKRFPDFIRTGPLKQAQNFSTLGLLPSYLKRKINKKIDDN